jgi:hypothetical protein
MREVGSITLSLDKCIQLEKEEGPKPSRSHSTQALRVVLLFNKNVKMCLKKVMSIVIISPLA